MGVQVQLKRWGNSLGLRIPKGVAEAAGLKADDAVNIDGSEEGFVVRKARPRLDLSALLDAVTPDNRHESQDQGGPVGRELL